MLKRDTWIEILQTILKNPLRYILTGISMAVGIFIMIVLLGLSTGLGNGVSQMFNKIAINSLSIDGGRTSMAYQGTLPNRRIRFTDKDYDKIARENEDVPTGSAIEQQWGMRMVWGNESDNFSLAGVNAPYLDLAKLEILDGRFLNKGDELEERKVIVLGKDVHRDLCKSAPVLGQRIMVGGIQFTIIGVFKRGESRWNNRKCYIPIQTYHKLFSATDKINEFLFSTGEMALDETIELEEKALNDLQVKYKVHPKDENAIYMNNFNVENAEYTNVLLGIKLFVLVIGLMTLISGVIGISNIMSIVVKERTRELGIRKALGATPRKIVGLILQESLLITVLSGFIGLIFGVVILEVVANFSGEDMEFFKNPAVDFNTAMLALGILIFSGIIAGLVPSIRAAKLRPIVALRDE
ncbi:MAG: ABC transporter permease [Flavobacteriales bacterium]